MQATPRQKADPPTVTEQARRSQIIAAAIETIAEVGYPKTSFAQIAKRAELSSTGLISYHFAGKHELNGAIVAHIYERLSHHMHAAMANATDPLAALHAYIRGMVGYMSIAPNDLRALMGIVLHGGIEWDATAEREATSPLAEILANGQHLGVFRDFNITVMATTIQRSLDGIPLAQQTNPSLDLDTYARELVELFTRAIRAEV
jgi:AcrR family transcriptional regulator